MSSCSGLGHWACRLWARRPVYPSRPFQPVPAALRSSSPASRGVIPVPRRSVRPERAPSLPGLAVRGCWVRSLKKPPTSAKSASAFGAGAPFWSCDIVVGMQGCCCCGRFKHAHSSIRAQARLRHPLSVNWSSNSSQPSLLHITHSHRFARDPLVPLVIPRMRTTRIV